MILAVGIGVAVTTHVAWNMYRFGAPMDFGYNWSETIPQLPPRPFLLADVPRGLTVLLLTPGKSLFLWAPILLFSLARARAFWSQERAVATGLAATIIIGVLLYAAYQFPEGGYSHGPRHLVPIVPLLLLPAVAVRPLIFRRTTVALCATVGLLMAVAAVSVSSLEDQALGTDLGTGARTRYYERIDPAPGRPWNRYRVAYIPFIDTVTSADWIHETTVGRGPDFLPLHLLQVRRSIPGGQAIPLWLVWAWPAAWLALLVISFLSFLPIRRQWRFADPHPR
jgi:hypothetical protein